MALPCTGVWVFRADIAAHTIPMGNVRNSPSPAVKNNMRRLIKNITMAPATVEYNIPSGPRNNVRIMANPMLFCDFTMITWG